jgi:hypothetical protein
MNKIEVNLPVKGSVRIAMNANQIITLAKLDGVAIEAVSGEFWVTLADDTTDYLLAPGERLDLHGRSQMIAQAMSEAELMLVETTDAEQSQTRATPSARRQSPIRQQLLDAAVNCWRTQFTRLSPYVNMERAF